MSIRPVKRLMKSKPTLLKIERISFAVSTQRCAGLCFAVGPVNRMLLLLLISAGMCGSATAQSAQEDVTLGSALGRAGLSVR